MTWLTHRVSSNSGPSGEQFYSSTKIFFFAHISFRIFGHTVTLTSPRCALRSRSIEACATGRFRRRSKAELGC